MTDLNENTDLNETTNLNENTDLNETTKPTELDEISDEEFIKGIDYNTEYRNKLRCPLCNRKTKKEDYISNRNTKKLTKSCIKCRSSVIKSIRKKQPLRPSKTEQILGLKDIIERVDKNIIQNILNDDESLKIYLD